MISRPTSPKAPRRALLPSALLAGTLLLGSGCVSSPHHLQRARALDRWQFEAVVGSALPLSSQVYDAALKAVDVIEPRVTTAKSGGKALNAAEVRSLVESGLALILFTPLPTTELSARLGVGYGVDVGLRLSGPRTQLDAKWQGLRQEEHGFDGALSLGVGRHSQPAESLLSSVSDVFQDLKILDYSRTDIALMALLSRDFGDFAAITGSFFYMHSAITVGSSIDESLAEVGVQVGDLVDAGPMRQIGGAVGLRLGYKYAWVTLEVAVAHVRFRPTLVGQQVDQSGWLVSPALGVVVRF